MAQTGALIVERLFRFVSRPSWLFTGHTYSSSSPCTNPYYRLRHWPREWDSRDHRLEKKRGVGLVLWSLKLGQGEPSYLMDPPGRLVYIRVSEERGTHTYSSNRRWREGRPKSHGFRYHQANLGDIRRHHCKFSQWVVLQCRWKLYCSCVEKQDEQEGKLKIKAYWNFREKGG